MRHLALLCALLAAAPVRAQEPTRLLVGTAGMFATGLEGTVAEMGLPRQRLWEWELWEPDVLQQYQAVLVSSPCAPSDRFTAALRAYIEKGGRGLLEMYRLEGPPPMPGPVLVGKGHANLKIVDVSTAISKGYDLGSVIVFPGLTGYTTTEGLPGATVIARYTQEGEGGGQQSTLTEDGGRPAVVLFRMDQGELIYAGAPLGFAISARGPQTKQLCANAIAYLCRGRGEPRFVLEDRSEVEPQPSAPVEPEPVEFPDTAPPEGLVELDPPSGPEYNVLAEVAAAGANGAEPAAVWFDWGPRGRFGCLAIAPDRWVLSARRGAQRRVLWQGRPQASWQTVLLKRRANRVEVLNGVTRLASVTWGSVSLGRVLLRSEGAGVRLADAVCQTLSAPEFRDDFMREKSVSDSWAAATGQWQLSGLPDPEYSVNGFTYVGQAASTGIACAGQWFWEDYACSVAARPLDNDASIGLCFYQRGPDDYYLFRVLSRSQPEPRAEIVRVRPGGEDVLASAPGACQEKQWYRLGVRVEGHGIRAYLDGWPVLSVQDDSIGHGGIGLWVRDGRVAFDDVEVLPAVSTSPDALPPARSEGTANAALPANVGAADEATWASRAVPWSAQPDRPTLLWHKGVYFGDTSLSLRLGRRPEAAQEIGLIFAPERSLSRAQHVTVALRPGSGKAAVTLYGGNRPRRHEISIGTPERPRTLELSRRGDRLLVLLGNKRLLSADARGGAIYPGLEVVGPAMRLSDLRLSGDGVRDYTFAAAPTDWHVGSGDWEVMARWACDQRWSWYAGQSEQIATLWSKHRYAGDVVLDCYLAVKHKGPGGDETERSRDLNTTLCGDGRGVNSGYAFVVGGDNGVVTSILKHGRVVAENPKARVPIGYSVHHQWHHIQVSRIGRTLTLSMENRPLVVWEDPEPLESGYAGVWTRNSAIMLARATIYAEREEPGKLLSLVPFGDGRSG